MSGLRSGPARAAAGEPGPDPGARRFVVCGGNALARRLTGELMDRYQTGVTVIVPQSETDQAPQIVALEPENGDPSLRPVVVAARQLSVDVFRQAGLGDAAALALVGQDDIANLDAALIAREVNPTVRIVARMFNPVLGEGITRMLGNCAVLSASEIAAPAFVAAALGEITPTYVRLPDQLLRVTGRSFVHEPNDIICGLAVTEGSAEPEMLPADESTADLVLVRAYGTPPPPRRHRRHPLRVTRLLFGRNLRIVLAALLAVLAVGTATLAAVRHLGVWPAAYVTILGALGGANADLGASGVEQVTEVLLAIVGIALVPALTASVVEVVVRARLALALGGLTEPVAGHVVVVGLGNLGTRVIRELHDFGVDIVAIDRSEEARGVLLARELGIPVVVGDATNPETLRTASVATCRALVVISTNDLTNLQTALLGRAIHQEHQEPAGEPHPSADGAAAATLPVVLRLFDEDFAARVTRAFDLTTSRSVSYLAAPAFAAAMVGREVIDTVPVGRHVLLLAELPIGAGSQLDGRICPEVSQPNTCRLVAVRTGRGVQTLWRPPERRKLVRTDRLVVVATRGGLAELLPRTIGIANPPPLREPELPRLVTMGGRRPDRPDPGPPADLGGSIPPPQPRNAPDPVARPDPVALPDQAARPDPAAP